MQLHKKPICIANPRNLSSPSKNNGGKQISDKRKRRRFLVKRRPWSCRIYSNTPPGVCSLKFPIVPFPNKPKKLQRSAFNNALLDFLHFSGGRLPLFFT